MNRRRAIVLCALAIVCAACAAAAVSRPRAPGPMADGGSDTSATDASPDGAEEARIDGAALRESLAPGMHEIAHEHVMDAGTYELAPTDLDRCYRLALFANEVVDVTLTDDASHVLATGRGRAPILGTRGPVCLRKGRRATLIVRGAAGFELFVWSAP